MKRLQFNDGSGNLTIREFAVMRDGSMLIKVSNNMGAVIWVAAEALEVVEL